MSSNIYRFEVGDLVVALFPLRNGNMVIPAGTVLKIEKRLRGYWLKSAPCKHCGIQGRVTQVPAIDLAPFIGRAPRGL
jgi:hypothetical protein